MRIALVAALLGALSCLRARAEEDIAAPKPGSSRFGAEDQRGAANLVTPQKAIRAARLIDRGNVYSLGRLYEEGMPLPNRRSYTLLIPQADPPRGKNKIVGHEEIVATQIGQVGTQFDGLGHVGIDTVFYNGNDRRDFVTPHGLAKLGIENVGPILTRGLLLDIAALKKRPRLPDDYEITREDLTTALKKAQLEIEPGDAVLIHTGWGSLWGVDNDLYGRVEPGIGIDAARFLIEKQIVLVGADNWAIEVFPGSYKELVHPVHQILITQNGTYNLENIDTSALARDRVYEFAFFFAPLRLKGATGSPGNPVAVR